jgi:hypothetical protein
METVEGSLSARARSLNLSTAPGGGGGQRFRHGLHLFWRRAADIGP